jgi:amidase
MVHRLSLAATALLAIASSVPAQTAAPATRADVVHEASITQLQTEMTAGRLTSVQLVDAYLARIAAYDRQGPTLNAMITVNPNARRDAAARDAERQAGRVRGPLHGVPVVIKDNYGTLDMPTTAGSVALAGFVSAVEADQVRRIREAGAVVLGKTNLHELAMGITSLSTMGGQTCNPYDPTRNPGGSSGGTSAAVAASFAAVGWGSDTCGSIRSPAASTNLFGLRPTKGLTSIAGIIPLAHTQDVAGPLARTVTDLAIALDISVGPDPKDPATRILDGKPVPRFTQELDRGALKGARIGVVTRYFGSATSADDQEGAAIVRAALARMKAEGAEVIDVVIPRLDSLTAGAGVIPFEFRYDFQDYMAMTPNAPVATLGDIIDRGLFHRAIATTLAQRYAMGTRDGAPYLAALKKREVARDSIVAFLDANKLDAIAYPTVTRKPALVGQAQAGANCTLSAVTGLPALSMPAGFTSDSLPIGLEILGRPLSDVRLVALAYAYEQAVQPRRPPKTTPALANPPKR